MQNQCRICPTCGDDHNSDTACDINDIFQIKKVRKELNQNLDEYLDMAYRLKHTEARLKECEDTLGFYAESKNWDWEMHDSNKTCNIIDESDVSYEHVDRDGVGGKRAREYFEKYKES